MKHISSEALTLEQVPDPDTCSDGDLWAFAHTFDAYAHWGGFHEAFAAEARAGEHACALMAKYPDDEDWPDDETFPEPVLDYCRTSMFLECRATRHSYNGEGYPAYFWKGLRSSVRYIRRRLTAGS